jgi:hypothetical protein
MITKGPKPVNHPSSLFLDMDRRWVYPVGDFRVREDERGETGLCNLTQSTTFLFYSGEALVFFLSTLPKFNILLLKRNIMDLILQFQT